MSKEIRQMIDKVKLFKQFINKKVTTHIDDIYIKYETSDKKAYADIEKTSNDTWHISLIESRRKGGGTELMQKIISDAKIQGIKKITLTT